MFFEDEKENIENNPEMELSDNETDTWDDVLDNEGEDDLISIKDTDDKDVFDDNDEISGLNSNDFDDELKLIDDGSDDVDDVEDVDDEELAKILNEDNSPSKQKAFDAFGNGSNGNEDTIIETDTIDGELDDVINSAQKIAQKEFKRIGISDDDIQESDDLTYTEVKQNVKLSPLSIFMLILLAVAVGVYIYLMQSGYVGGNIGVMPNDTNSQNSNINNPNVNTPHEPIPVVNEEEVNTVKPDVAEKKEVVNVQTTGKVNPFVPIQKYVAKSVSAPDETYYNYDASGIPKPPIEYGELNETTTKLMSISVSGIMYDSVKPSAIITLDGNDYFVQKGDKLNDYRVIDITRNNVKISLGKNIYTANLGEQFKIDKFYGNAEYIPSRYGGGKQYYIVNSDSSSQEGASQGYSSASDVQVNSY